MDDSLKWYLLGVGVSASIILLLGSAFLSFDNKHEELGQAICDERFGRDFDQYFKGTLTCKDRPVTVPYDGIRIRIT